MDMVWVYFMAGVASGCMVTSGVWVIYYYYSEENSET